MTKPTAMASCEMRFHRLDNFITLHGSELPQIVKVGKGFNGTSVDQSVETGEILIISKVERKKKILAQQLSSGRRICFPRTCNVKVELVTDPSQEVYSTLDAVPSRYVRVLENITPFGLLAGDVLHLNSQEPPCSNGCDARCLIVSMKDPVYVDLPGSVEGKFQALSNYGILSIDEVLKECSLPVNVCVVSENQSVADTCPKHATSLPIAKCGNIQLECEIEEETVLAISALKEENRILIFPKTLDISVAQYVPQREFLSRSGTEYKQLVNAIKNDKILHDKLNSDCVYFTSDPVKKYSLEMLQLVSFPFDRKQRVVTTGCRDTTGEQDHFCLRLDSSAHPQKGTHETKGIEPSSFRENEAPPLPPKMSLIATQCHVSTKKDQVRNIESKQESERQWNSFDTHGQQEEPSCYFQNDFNDHSLFRPRDQSHRENTPLQLMSKQRDDAANKMHISGDSFPESEEAAFPVSYSKRTALYEPEVDVNANLSFNSGVLTNSKPKQTLVEFVQPTQTPCYLSHSLPRIKPDTTDEERGDHLPQKPLLVMENDFSQGFTAETSEKAENREEHTRQKCDRSSPEQSDDYNEENNNIDNLDLNFPEEFSDGYRSNVQYGRQGSVDTEPDRQGELKSPGGSTEGDHYRTSGDNPKKKFFHSLTRKPRWFRQDSSKPAKKDKCHSLKTKSKDVKIPPRHAASCEDILISSPREDDFECMTSITKYLETQDKLTKALVHISRLQNQGQKDWEKAAKLEGNKDLANTQEKSASESVKAWQRKESEIEIQCSQTQDKTLPFTPANAPEDPEASGLPVPHFLALKQSARAWQNPTLQGESENRRAETNSRRLGMSSGRHARAATNGIDSESALPPSYGFQRDNGHDEGRRESEDREPHQTCPCCRYHFTDTFGRELSESAAKSELKKAILQMNWSEDEWMELTETVRRKISDTKGVPHVNLALSRERPENLPMDLTTAENSSYPKSNDEPEGRRVGMPPYVNINQGSGNQRIKEPENLPMDLTTVENSSYPKSNDEPEGRRVGMPPYVNINQGSGGLVTPPYQNIARGTTQGSTYNDVQRLASRSQGKPPIPTPRSERSSI